MLFRSPQKVKIYWDHAFYHGKYYCYFGVIPAIGHAVKLSVDNGRTGDNNQEGPKLRIIHVRVVVIEGHMTRNKVCTILDTQQNYQRQKSNQRVDQVVDKGALAADLIEVEAVVGDRERNVEYQEKQRVGEEGKSRGGR